MKYYIALSFAAIFLLASCEDSDKSNSKEENNSIENTVNSDDATSANTHKIVVKETISSGGYVYIKASEKDREYWMAIPDRQVEVGATYYYDGGMVMTNFESKTLKRTFESVVFAQGIRESNDQSNTVEKAAIQEGSTSVTNVDKAPNGIRISELFENPKAFENKEVVIRGQVVKVNNDVMNVNFIHLQDGTTGNGKYDITVTSLDQFNMDDVVTIKGTVVLNKDFGAGYSYDVLIEKASIVK